MRSPLGPSGRTEITEMENEIDELIRRLVRLEDELEGKLEERRSALHYRIEEKRAVFEDTILRRHRKLKTGLVTFLRRSPLAILVISPAIYGLILPLVFLDLGVSVLQLICFSAWGIPRIRRSSFVVLDRHRLAYLNGIEKLNCAYCSYANGVIAYAREAASLTEQYWCPIKHALRVRNPHRRYHGFVEYGDAEGYGARLEALRAEARKARKT